MEKADDETGVLPYQEYASDFGLIDFMDQCNLDQFIELIRGENDVHDPLAFGQHNNIGNCYVDDAQYLPPIELLDFDDPTIHFVNGNTNFSVPNRTRNEVEDEEIEEEGSSATTTTTTTTSMLAKNKSKKTDRSRTLISERRRRGRMKEKLYALRALVPNITKMDKASIVGDAVLYVQDLQMQTKKLKADISRLELSLAQKNKYDPNSIHQNPLKIDHAKTFHPIIKKIFQIDVVGVEERDFFVRIVCSKGKGVAGFLYRALDSFTCFTIQSSNLAAVADNYVLKFNLHVQSEMDLNLSNMKLCIASAFLNQGFDFVIS